MAISEKIAFNLMTSIQAALSEDSNQESLNRIAEIIHARGLDVPAIFTLELCKPLSSLLLASSQGALPILQAICGLEKTKALMTLLESRENIEAIIVRLESLSAANGN